MERWDGDKQEGLGFGVHFTDSCTYLILRFVLVSGFQFKKNMQKKM